jgi:hypothetical protein
MEDCRFAGAGSAVANCMRKLYVTDSDGARGTLTDEITETLVPTIVGDALLALECVHSFIVTPRSYGKLIRTVTATVDRVVRSV